MFYFIFDLQFVCDPNIINKVQTNLEKFKYDVIHAEEEHLAIQKVSLNELEYEHITKFINQVEALQDVIHVYDNLN
jgi:transcriptional/translational regulatory protein YebC/TACO1